MALRMQASLFTHPSCQLELVKGWNEEFGWGFEPEDFDQLGDPPGWPHKVGLGAVVLDWQLDSPEETLMSKWDLITRHFRRGGLWQVPDPIVYPFGSRRLRWERVALGAQGNLSDGAQQVHGIGSVIFSAAALHPVWLKDWEAPLPYVRDHTTSNPVTGESGLLILAQQDGIVKLLPHDYSGVIDCLPEFLR